MDYFDTLRNNNFVQTVFKDAQGSLEKDPGKLDPPDAAIDEYQFYLQRVGFNLSHTLTWLDQLTYAVEFLTNYDYSKSLSTSRADHLIYNIENYLIRVNAAYDRALQLVNSVFHLCMNDEYVAHSVIITNAKVQHRPTVVSKLKVLRRTLNVYSQERHTIVHKHSLLDEKLRRIELFYQDGLLAAMSSQDRARHKAFRADYLRRFVVAKRKEFGGFNASLSSAVYGLFDALAVEYSFQKRQFEVRGF